LINGEVHFGWARLTVTCGGPAVVAKLSGYAYETVANKAIIAGETKGDEEAIAKPEASVNGDAYKAAPLGLLAMGAQSLSTWRRLGS
jgi:hypothetical protein